TAPSIHDPITRSRVSYLNGGGAKDFQNNRKNGVGEWTPERMGEKKFLRVVIWNEPPPFFGEMPHNWLKERADYYEEVLTDYRAKCSRLQELKKKIRRQNNRVQSDLFREALPVAKKWEYLESE
ncbi:11011_t:CDS:2, partial [Gigaspora margarita]